MKEDECIEFRFVIAVFNLEEHLYDHHRLGEAFPSVPS